MREEPKEQALLLGVKLNDGEDFVRSMEELANLAVACGMEVAGQITQNMERPHSALYMGKGKLSEVKEYLEQHPVDVVIFDRSLSPSQLRNLEQILDCAILDRTSLILEIFAERARTREARLQVESARLQYVLPRLTGMHKALSRQGGGSGVSNKGAGDGGAAPGTGSDCKGERNAAQKTPGKRCAQGGSGRLYQCRKVYIDEPYAGPVYKRCFKESAGKGHAVRNPGYHGAQNPYRAGKRISFI